MRLTRRIGDAARAATVLREGAGADPTAVYARILDGRRLWLAVSATGLTAGDIRLLADGSDVTPPDDAPSDPAYLSLRWDLDALPAARGPEDETTYDVVAAGRPLRVGDLPAVAPMRTPPDSTGRWQYAVHAGEVLTLSRTPHPVAAEIEAIEADGAEVVLRMSDPGTRERPEVRLRSTDGHAATWPVTREGESWVARVRESVVPHDLGLVWTLDLVDDERSWPVTRARNACAAPGRALALPILWGRGSGAAKRSEVRFAYRPDGRLRVQRPAPTAGSDA